MSGRCPEIAAAGDFDPIRKPISDEQLWTTVWRMQEINSERLQRGIVFSPDGTISSLDDPVFGTWKRYESYLYIFDANGKTVFVLSQSRHVDVSKVTFEGPLLRDPARRFYLQPEET